MRGKVVKKGKSYAVLIPDAFLEAHDLKIGETVTIDFVKRGRDEPAILMVQICR